MIDVVGEGSGCFLYCCFTYFPACGYILKLNNLMKGYRLQRYFDLTKCTVSDFMAELSYVYHLFIFYMLRIILSRPNILTYKVLCKLVVLGFLWFNIW